MRSGSRVNLERPLPADGRLDGHIVLGHVTGTARIRSWGPAKPGAAESSHGEPGAWFLVVDLDPSWADRVAVEGSIAIDGISLTVAGLEYPADSSEDGRLASGDSLKAVALRLGLTLIGVADIVRYRRRRETLVRELASASLPTRWGSFTIHHLESPFGVSDLRLGFPSDMRKYWEAAQVLRLLGRTKVRLLTNNPDKVAGLEDYGIEVMERVPLKVPSNSHNLHYIETKRDRLGHAI